jgi:hypothetical protein
VRKGVQGIGRPKVKMGLQVIFLRLLPMAEEWKQVSERPLQNSMFQEYLSNIWIVIQVILSD